MSNILELYEKRMKIWEAAKAFLDSKRDNNGMLSAEDTATYDKMKTDIVALSKEIDKLEHQATIGSMFSHEADAKLTKSISLFKSLNSQFQDYALNQLKGLVELYNSVQ